MTKAIYKNIGIIKAIRPHMTKKTMAKIGGTLINGSTEYGAVVWGGAASAMIETVQRAQTSQGLLN